MRAKFVAVVLIAACGGIIGPVPPIIGGMSAEQPSSVVGAPPGALFSLVDNPEIETIFSLPADHAVSGAPLNFEVQGFRASHVVNTYYGDLLIHLAGGDGSPNTDGTISAFLGAVNGTLERISEMPQHDHDAREPQKPRVV